MPSYNERLASAFEDELQKIAQHKQAASLIGVAAPMIAGAGLFEWARRANRDRQMGRAMRLQSNQSY